MNIRQRTVTTLLAVVAVTLGPSLIVGGSPAAGAQPMGLVCPWDLDNSGDVDVPDLLTLLATWGNIPTPDPPDFDGDGVVAVPDLWSCWPTGGRARS